MENKCLYLSNEYDEVQYFSGSAPAYVPIDDNEDWNELPADEATAAEEPVAPTETPVPTPSPEELRQIACDEEVAALRTKLAEYDAAGDVEGALEYLTEQLQLLQTTYSDKDFSELEQQKTQYLDAYRQQSLDGAKAAFEATGYADALNVLYHATTLLGGEDKQIVDAIAYYKQFGPIAFEDYYDTYFYQEPGSGMWSLKHDVKDNTGETCTVAVRVYADKPWYSPYKSVYLLTGKHSSFTGRLFLDEQTRSTPSEQIVRIYGDDTLLWESPAMTKGVLPVDFNIDLTGYAQMTIESEVTAFRNSKHVNIFIANGSLNP